LLTGFDLSEFEKGKGILSAFPYLLDWMCPPSLVPMSHRVHRSGKLLLKYRPSLGVRLLSIGLPLALYPILLVALFKSFSTPVLLSVRP